MSNQYKVDVLRMLYNCEYISIEFSSANNFPFYYYIITQNCFFAISLIRDVEQMTCAKELTIT